MNYHIMYKGITIESITFARTDAEAKKYARSRYAFFDSLEDDSGRILCTKKKKAV